LPCGWLTHNIPERNKKQGILWKKTAEKLAPCLGVVVAEVRGDDGAGADEVIFLVEDEAGPGELAGARQPVGQTLSRSVPNPVCGSREIMRKILSSLIDFQNGGG
jgi:hypothetical protein